MDSLSHWLSNSITYTGWSSTVYRDGRLFWLSQLAIQARRTPFCCTECITTASWQNQYWSLTVIEKCWKYCHCKPPEYNCRVTWLPLCRARYAIARRPSLCPSHRRITGSVKTVEVRIMQLSPQLTVIFTRYLALHWPDRPIGKFQYSPIPV